MIARELAICLLGVLSLNAYEPAGVVELNIVSSRGGAVSPGTITVISAGAISFSTGDPRTLSSHPLPFGTYELRFEAQGWKSTSRRILVDRPEVFITLGVVPDDLTIDAAPAPLAVSVRIRTPNICHAGSFLWARLVGVFSGSIQDARLSPTGFALFDPVSYADYALLVLEGGEVRAIQVLTTSKPVTVVDINLSPCRSQTPPGG